MGNCAVKVKQCLNKIFKKKKSVNSKIGNPITCQRCGKTFNGQTTFLVLNAHLDSCLNTQDSIMQEQPNNLPNNMHFIKNSRGLLPQSPQAIQQQQKLQQQQQTIQLDQINMQHEVNELQIEQPQLSKKKLNEDQISENFDDYLWAKVPDSEDKTQYKWELVKLNKNITISQIKNLNKDEAKKLSFEEKQVWFRQHLEKFRIHWMQGADWLSIQKDNVLLTSLETINLIDLHKEVKIEFQGEKVQDAGGLLREWIYMIMKEIFHPNTGLFILAETEEVTYRINPSADFDDHIFECFRLFGKIIGKAIFERIPLNAFLDRTLLKYILKQEINLEDIRYFDKELYQSWKHIKETILQENDFIDFFVIYKRNNKQCNEIELKPGGKDIVVNNENKEEFIQLNIEYMTQKSIKPFLECICQEIYKVVPFDLLSIFEVYEFEMILNGLPFININDWEQNTEYKGVFHKNHQVICWFWKILRSFDQERLQKFLQYCTGSSRTPVEGFKKLESNRGNLAKFCIESLPYNEQSPYPLAHTCFNRLELPLYPNYEIAEKSIQSIVKNDLEGVFGME